MKMSELLKLSVKELIEKMKEQLEYIDNTTNPKVKSDRYKALKKINKAICIKQQRK